MYVHGFGNFGDFCSVFVSTRSTFVALDLFECCWFSFGSLRLEKCSFFRLERVRALVLWLGVSICFALCGFAFCAIFIFFS